MIVCGHSNCWRCIRIGIWNYNNKHKKCRQYTHEVRDSEQHYCWMISIWRCKSNQFEGRGTWKKWSLKFFLKQSLGHTKHTKNFSSLLTLVSSKPRLKLSPFSLPVCVEIQIPLWVWFHICHRENDSSSTMSPRFVAAVCSNTHCDSVSLFRLPRDSNIRNKWMKRMQCTRAKWKPMGNFVLCSEHFEENCLSLEQI